MEQKTKIKAEEGKQDLTITREFDLPVTLLFSAYEDPELVAQWMGTKVLKMDHQKHGSFEFETSHNGKVMFRASGCIHDIIPDKKIVRTFEMEGMSIGAQLEFLEFEKLTDNTSKLSMHIVYKSVQHRAEQLKLPFAYGINKAHDKLQEILNK